MGREQMNDPIHKRKDGWWYFWDESSVILFGPYLSRKEAKKKLQEHEESIKLHLEEANGCKI
jgi:hypothetical protein